MGIQYYLIDLDTKEYFDLDKGPWQDVFGSFNSNDMGMGGYIKIKVESLSGNFVGDCGYEYGIWEDKVYTSKVSSKIMDFLNLRKDHEIRFYCDIYLYDEDFARNFHDDFKEVDSRFVE